MMIRLRTRHLVPILLAGLGVHGCAETQLAVYTAKQIARPAPPAGDGAGAYKVGKPYQVHGVWYYPKADYAYEETGIASWYGPGFDGRRTANGETYDENRLTAAHRTLPMPSIVRVTNLENGRSIEVRVNDRGPFKNGRIIDVSRRAADLLGFRHSGTAKVRVKIVEDESRRLATIALAGEAAALAPDPVPTVPVTAEPLHSVNGVARPTQASTPAASQTAAAVPRRPVATVRPPAIPPAPDGTVTTVPVGPSAIYVQAGAFTRFDYANRLRARLSGLGAVGIAEAVVADRRFYRVRIGPVGSVEAADRLLDLLIANGHAGARVVVD
ncbi:MAG: septal ring lytic transglycosylase RlpA family protein [Kiloniellaceae bacterium]